MSRAWPKASCTAFFVISLNVTLRIFFRSWRSFPVAAQDGTQSPRPPGPGRRQKNLIRLGGQLLQLVHNLFLARRHHQLRHKCPVHQLHANFVLRQVHDVPNRRAHLKALAQILLDRLALAGDSTITSDLLIAILITVSYLPCQPCWTPFSSFRFIPHSLQTPVRSRHSGPLPGKNHAARVAPYHGTPPHFHSPEAFSSLAVSFAVTQKISPRFKTSP